MDILQGLVPCFSSSSVLSGSIVSFLPIFSPFSGFPVAQLVKNLAATQETWVQSLGWEDPLEKEMAPHSSILAWRIPWTEEPGGLQFMGSQRVGHNRERLTHTLKQKQKTKLEFFWNFQSLKILGFQLRNIALIISQQCDIGFPHLCIFSTQPSTWDRVGVNMYSWNKCFSLYCPVQFSLQYIMLKLVTN